MTDGGGYVAREPQIEPQNTLPEFILAIANTAMPYQGSPSHKSWNPPASRTPTGVLLMPLLML